METPERGLIVSCLPDTGCTQSIISADLARRIGATIDTQAAIQLLTANGGSISVLGQARLYLQLKDKTTVQGRVSLSNLYLANSAIHYLDSVDLCEAMIAFVPVH